MKLALITRRYPPLIGGAEVMICYLAQALAEAGSDVTVLTSRFAEARSSPKSEVYQTTGGRLEIIRLHTSGLKFLGTWLYMRNLRKWLRNHPPDLAYVSMLKHDAFVAIKEGQRLGYPVVLRPEGAGATGDLAWQKWGRFGRKIASRCHQADQVVAISQAIRDELILDQYDPMRLIEIPNGVPVPVVPWQPRNGWKNSPVAVSVGRLSPEKGHADLLAAWPLVLEQIPDARLVLVGDGPERQCLEAIIEQNRMADSVILVGSTGDVPHYLLNADLFVLPSREEGMSMALLEAMAFGMPLVATDIPGNRKLVTDTEHGRLCGVEDPRSLAQAIVEQWCDPVRALEMGQAARSLVQHQYSIEAVARLHLAQFEQLIVARHIP